jgi:release factor glutamine methyltransferase
MTAGRRTWADLYLWATEQLGDRQAARWMFEEVSGLDWPGGDEAGEVAPLRAESRLVAMVERRRKGEPLQYVLGSWSFRTLDLMVDRRVLIPRPETEQVVEAALAELDRLAAARTARTEGGEGEDTGPLTAVDLGTGSGAIALSLAAERRRVVVWATDRSVDALAVARANLAGLAGSAATRVRLVEGDWWSALPAELTGKVDLVVSNPPYISAAEMDHLDPVVRDWEPRSALEAGPEGTEALAAVLGEAPRWLRPGGVAVIELAPHQAEWAEAVARASGFAATRIVADLAGRQRALVAASAGL